MRETADERKLENHRKYLRAWDRWEQHMTDHFATKAAKEAGRDDEASDAFLRMEATRQLAERMSAVMAQKRAELELR